MLKTLFHSIKQHNRIRRTLGKIPVDVKQIAPFADWSNSDFDAPSPPLIKQRVLLRLISPGQHFVETGTYKGKTALALHSAGYPVTTIEVHKPLFDSISPALQSQGIECYLGDSGTVFVDLLPKLKAKDVFFWLDGHFSGGETGKGDQDTPIVNELECIRSELLSMKTRITIAVDDFRLFPNGDVAKDYPTRNFLVDWARENNLSWTIEHDIFVMKNWQDES